MVPPPAFQIRESKFDTWTGTLTPPVVLTGEAMAAKIQRIKTECRDFLEVVFFPALAAILPWRMCFKIFKILAKWDFLYREPAERALFEAAKRGWASDPKAWLARRKLVTLVDHADHYLARTRSDAWMARHLEVSGEWPASDKPALLLTYHWGAGMWALRHANAAGIRGHMLVAAVNSAHFAGHSVLHRYIKARTASIALALRRPTVDVSVSLKPVLKALRAQEQVIAVIDVPADQVNASAPVDILGMTARVPTALLRLAVEKSLPVTLFLTGINLVTGKRTLNIKSINPSEDLISLTACVFNELSLAIEKDPAAWHFWSESQRFFVHSCRVFENSNHD